MKVLWLASWYPNPVDPYDGDFIQRHARALATHIPVTIFYVAQWGEQVNVMSDRVIEQEIENVHEKIFFFRFRKTGFSWLDKIIYNIRYYKSYKQAIKKYFTEEGRPELVHVHVPMKAGVIARWINRKWGIPFIVSEHSSLYDREAKDNFFQRNFWHRKNVKRIFQDALAVTNVSDAVGNIMKDLFGLQQVSTIHNTVHTDYFNYKPSSHNKFRFIHVSTFSFQKNIEGILSAVSRLSQLRQDFEFVLVGLFDQTVSDAIRRYNLGSVVTCTGEISYPEVAEEMQKVSALVLFSRYENFPCVIIEALCCGLPCISTDVGGVSEAINVHNGILISKEDEDALIDAMNRMINNYQKFNREQISAEATRKYSYQEIGKQFLDFYNQILNKN